MRKVSLLSVHFFIFLTISDLLYSLEYMKIDEIKPGMKGYGLSVFKGWEPEKFEVEIIDIIRNTRPKASYILARLKGQNLEQSGVIAGMSGSPVYIDGKIVGAVAYTWSFSKEPICGITPIENMLEEKKYADLSFKKEPFEEKNLKKIATPVMLDGYSGFAKNYLEDFFAKKSSSLSSIILPGSKIDSSSLQTSNTTLKPGDAVAINLVEGDLNVQGIGTVTYVDGDDVFIFGHPMDEVGKISLPISKAYIYTVIPSSYLSFKIGASSSPSGTTVYDGQNAVYCKLKKEAEMIPFEIKISEGSFVNTYKLRIANSPTYFPYLATASTVASILNQTGYLDDKRINLKFYVDFSDREKNYIITNELTYSYFPAYYNFFSLSSDLNSFFSLFFNNSLKDLFIKNVKIEIKLQPETFYYTVENFGVDKKSYKPGEVIRCKVTLKALKGEYFNKVFEFKIPKDIEKGQYVLFCGSQPYFYYELKRSFPAYYRINNIDDLVYWGSFKTDFSKLVIGLVSTQTGLIIKDKKLSDFPEIYQDFFSSYMEKSQIPAFPRIIKSEFDMDAAIFNSSRILLTIGEIKSSQKE